MRSSAKLPENVNFDWSLVTVSKIQH